MELARARKIVADMVAVRMHSMGITREEPPSLMDYTLGEMLEANRIISEGNKDRASGRVSIHCDPRLTAALYTIAHYHGEPADGPEPIVVMDGKALICIELPEGFNGDEAETV